jgi:propionyl-CoA carboxylase alpha chain
MISRYYDPMIAKVCTYADDRDQAIEMMEDGLSEFIVRGVRHNIAFCLDIMRNLRFREGNISTKFIDQEYKDGFKGATLSDKELSEVASTLFVWDYVKYV